MINKFKNLMKSFKNFHYGFYGLQYIFESRNTIKKILTEY